MKRIRLLDCTLRDGGFVNEWKFGEECIINIFERLELAGIDILKLDICVIMLLSVRVKRNIQTQQLSENYCHAK